jgi:dipeptidyl aminopeptidase/acylaminoacyl peptidase
MRTRIVVAITLALLAVLSSADAAPAPMTPRQVAELQAMSAAVISPNGLHVAATRTVPRQLFSDKDGPAYAELIVIDLPSGTIRPFITGEVKVESIGWLPDSSAVSFLAQRGDDEHTSLYLIAIDGGEARRVLALDTDIAGYSFSPDGARVAAVAAEPEPDKDHELAEQGFDQTVYEEDWKPSRVWIAPVAGETAKATALTLDSSAFAVGWSPNADRLAVALAPTPLIDDRYMSQQIHIVDIPGDEIVAHVEHAAKLRRFEWSPDGTHLAMIAGVDLHDPSPSSLFVVGADGGSPRNLSTGLEGTLSDISWANPGTIIALVDVGVTTCLLAYDVAGSGPPKPISSGGSSPTFTSLSLASDGRSGALVGSSPSYPPEVFFADLAESHPPRRLTTTNPWLDDVALAPQEVVRFKARDGLELEGLLIRPLSEQPGQRYPLILVAHGGPEAHYRNGWLTRYSQPGQVLAGRGFAVCFPNYRGSTGRGVAFSKLSQADAAGKEFDDLVDAVDHLIANGLVDRAKVGITGGSYGGYATAWAATRYSDRFAAGVMFVGISNSLSKFGTTDIPREEALVHALKPPYDAVDFCLERSPVSHAAGARTPLLIVHGKKDPRVSVTQSMELYRALKTVGEAPVRLVLYPEEGHGNRRAAARYDYCLRLIRWMEHYLAGPGGDPPPHRIGYRNPADGWPAVQDNDTKNVLRRRRSEDEADHWVPRFPCRCRRVLQSGA